MSVRTYVRPYVHRPFLSEGSYVEVVSEVVAVVYDMAVRLGR